MESGGGRNPGRKQEGGAGSGIGLKDDIMPFLLLLLLLSHRSITRNLPSFSSLHLSLPLLPSIHLSQGLFFFYLNELSSLNNSYSVWG